MEAWQKEIPVWTNIARNFCNYQERYQEELRQRLEKEGIPATILESIIAEMISEGLLNEERYAKAFVSGKFRIKKWGKIKICNELKAKKIQDYCIKKALDEIDFETYKSTLQEIIQKKKKQIIEQNPIKKKQKLATFAISKGFESNLVWDYLNLNQ